jgi:hypothetical protein
MKQYPPILGSTGAEFREIPNAYVFDKLDGSNLRFEWSRKRGWYKFGARHRMFDASDAQFGAALPLFMSTLADGCGVVAKKEGWESVVVFAEYHGPNSFAGYHPDGSDQMRLDLIDVSPHRHGILPPGEFLDLFGDLPHAKFLGRHNWTRGFVERVWNGEIEGVTLEGVVGKVGGGKSHDLVMAKAKTKVWIDMIHARFSPDEAEKIIRS